MTYPVLNCTQVENWTHTVTIQLNVSSSGTVTGSAGAQGTSVLAAGCPGTAIGTTGNAPPVNPSQVTGTTSSLVFSGSATGCGMWSSCPTRLDEWNFVGSLAAGVISGTLEYTVTYFTSAASGGGRGSARFAVTAREQ